MNFTSLVKVMEESMFHTAPGKFTKTIYNSTSPMDAMPLINGLITVLMELPSLENTIT